MRTKPAQTYTHNKSRILAVGLGLILLSTSAVVAYGNLLPRQASLARDPTYGEVMQFVAEDFTDRSEYVDGRYTCYNFALDFRSHAQSAGYKCGFVIVYFQSGRSHSLNCFNTTDSGSIFIEPQTDDVVSMVIGESYWHRTSLEQPIGYDDTIVECLILW